MKKLLISLFLSTMILHGSYAQFNLIINHVTCNGICNGNATVTGTQNHHQIAWNDGQTGVAATNLCAGAYSVEISDSSGNPINTLIAVITEPPFLFVEAFATDASCTGSADGTIDLTVTGGTPPYQYLWSNGSASEDLFGLPAGVYSITVVDNNGCDTTISVLVNEGASFSVNIDVINESSCGACDGSLTALTNGGTPTYTYTWATGETTATITNLCFGFYTATVTDINGCIAVASGTVFSDDITVNVTNSSPGICGQVDTVQFSFSGGTPPYQIDFGDGGTAQTGLNTVTHFYSDQGIYTITVADSLGCSGSVNHTVTNSSPFITLDQVTRPTCNGSLNGMINVNVSGGVPPYLLSWNHGPTTDSIINLDSGTYSLTVTDGAGCTSTFVYNLTQNTGVGGYYVYLTQIPSNCSTNGSIAANPYNGTPPYSYYWNTLPPQTTQTAIDLSPGDYSVTVTDSMGCERYGNMTLQSNCYNVVTGSVFHDVNHNCIFDSTDTPAQNISVRASTGNNYYYGYSNANGEYTIRIGMSGTFTLTAHYNYYGCGTGTLCNPDSISFAGLGDSSINNMFGIVNNGYDLSLHPGWRPANPGFQKKYWIYYHNQSNTPFSDTATIIFQYDSALTFLSSGIPFVTHDSATHTLTWTVNGVASAWGGLIPEIWFQVPASLPLGYLLQSEFHLTPTSGDCDLSDNHLYFSDIVTGSRDPNEKEVVPASDILEEDSILTYTIHFQNNGTDTTHFVILKDTLSSYLDPVSVQNIASSHDITEFDISGKGILTWIFNPIFLVDSATNEPESKGFVTFKIRKKPGLAPGTTIENKAAIYFDYNEPIITNTVENTLYDPVSTRHLTGNDKVAIVYPNPSNERLYIIGNDRIEFVQLYDIYGKQVLSESATGERSELNLQTILPGVYLLKISVGGQSQFDQIIKY